MTFRSFSTPTQLQLAILVVVRKREQRCREAKKYGERSAVLTAAALKLDVRPPLIGLEMRGRRGRCSAEEKFDAFFL